MNSRLIKRVGFFSVLLVPILAFVSAYSQEQATPPPENPLPSFIKEKEKSRSQKILDQQIQLLQEQGLVSKGRVVKRRFKEMIEKAEEAADAEDFQKAALYYYSIIENPEFAGFLSDETTQMALIENLYASGIDYVALDYIMPILEKGPSSPNFVPAFGYLVDILNRLRNWGVIEPVFEMLNQKFSSLPTEIRNDANYLYGRQSFFLGQSENAKTIFGSIPRSSRFYPMARYHLGILAVFDNNVGESLRYFQEAQDLAVTLKDPEQATALNEFASLAVARVNYHQNQPANFNTIPRESERFPISLFEGGWDLFRETNYSEAFARTDAFIDAFPFHPLLPEVFLLRAHAQMELGDLPRAADSFHGIIERYESTVNELAAIAQKRSAKAVVADLQNLQRKGQSGEVLAWIMDHRLLERVQSSEVIIAQEEKNLQESEEAWQTLRGILVSGDNKVVFPGRSRMKPFAGRDRPAEYVTGAGNRLQQVEIMREEQRLRLEELESGLEGITLEKGRVTPLQRAIAAEREKMENFNKEMATLKKRVATLEKKVPKLPKRPESPFKGGVQPFEDLISSEEGWLPELRQALTSQRDSLDAIRSRFLRTRVRYVSRQLDRLVRGAYLGEIEVAFLNRTQMSRNQEQAMLYRQELIGLINAFIDRYPKAEEIPQQLFRLAELAYEQSRDKFFTEQEIFDREYERFLSGNRPTQPREPKPDYSESISICRRVIKNYPTYDRLDQVYYLLGYYLEEEENRAASIAVFRQLIEKYPESEFITEAYMRLAENFFDQDNYSKAIDHYEIILKYPESVFFELALYKMAWSYFKIGDYDEAITNFSRLVAFSDGKLAQGTGDALDTGSQERLTDLRDESLTYLALCFSESGGPDALVRHMGRVGLDRYTSSAARRLADIYFAQTRFKESIGAYRKVLELNPMDTEGPEHQAKIIEAYEKIGEPMAAFEERKRLADEFGPRSTWTQQNVDNVEAITKAQDLVEDALVYSATYYHERAQKSKKEEEYRLAIEAYRQYIWDFPDRPKTYEMRFFYAEALYAVKDYEVAGYHYRKTVEAQVADPKYRNDAAFNGVLSYEKLLAQRGQDFEAKARELVRLEVPQEEEALRPANVQKRPLSELEIGLLTAYDQYVQVVPLGQKVPEVTFKSGILFFQAQDYPQAINRFVDFYKNYPSHSLAPRALNYVLNAYIVTRDWPKVELWSRKILKTPALGKTFDSKQMKKLITVSMLYEAQKTQKSGDLAKAAGQFLAIDQEFQGDPLAARAMFNAAANYEKLGRADLANATFENLVKRHPRSELAPDALFRVSKSYERRAEFAKAASYYERLGKTYPKSKFAADAIINAGLLRELAGQDDLAAQDFLAYAQKFPTKEDATEAHFLAAEAYERSGNYAQAASTYLAHAQTYAPSGDRRVECFARAGLAYQKRGDPKTAQIYFSRTRDEFRKNSKSVKAGGRHYAALTRFEEGKVAFQRFEAVRFTSPKKLAGDLELKAKRLESANKIFLDVVAVGDPVMATAGLFMVGRGYQVFSESLFSAPVPKGMDEEAMGIYRAQLEEQAFPIEDKAIEAYEKGLAKAYELKTYGEWTEKTLGQLQKYRPGKYPPMDERVQEMVFGSGGLNRIGFQGGEGSFVGLD